jgi:sulfate transport system ATP-binding protein
MGIEAKGITKRFGDFTALRDVSLAVGTGELVALLGPSGSGKTTLLRVIAGLERPDAGVVLLDGRDATGIRPDKRRVGFVFQHYALFRHMTVFENVAFGLRVRPRLMRPSEREIRERVMRLLSLVQIQFLADQYPLQLSGGQRQRVALARALAVEPAVLLLDEPFGALDAKVRQELRRWLRRLHDEIHVTSVFVTHDQEEALEVADRIVVFNEGRIVQEGTPEAVYDHPATPFVFNFLGNVNLFHGRVEADTVSVSGPASVDGKQASGEVVVYARTHQIDLATTQSEGAFPATVTRVNRAGPVVKIELTPAWGGIVLVELTPERFAGLEVSSGSRLFVTLRKPRVFGS